MTVIRMHSLTAARRAAAGPQADSECSHGHGGLTLRPAGGATETADSETPP